MTNKLNGAEIVNLDLNSPESLERRRLIEIAHANTDNVIRAAFGQEPDKNNIVYPDFDTQTDEDFLGKSA